MTKLKPLENITRNSSILVWRLVQLHVHPSVHMQIDLGAWKISHSDKFHLLHNTCVKQNVKFAVCSYLLVIIPLFFSYFSFSSLLLSHFLLIIDSIGLCTESLITESTNFLLTEKQDRILVYPLYVVFRVNY